MLTIGRSGRTEVGRPSSILTPIWSMSEFASLEPSGRFYLKRPLAEDASAKLRKAAPGTIVDLNAAITDS